MLRLESQGIELVLDPARGGEVRSLRPSGGPELLFQAPWDQGGDPAPDADERSWTEAWQGGWQLLFPNAGASCEVGARRHGFHGAASLARWEVERAEPDCADLRWTDPGGLVARRSVAVEARTVRARTEVEHRGSEPAAFVLVEHLIFGEPLAGPEARVQLAGGTLVPLADEGFRLPGAEVSEWPYARRDDGVEDWSRGAEAPVSRFGAVIGVPGRRARVTSAGGDLAVELQWSETFPNLWFWEEGGGATEAPWLARTSCLGLEPASVPTGEGLARSLERGEATILGPGERAVFELELEVFAAG